jgi:hypothetical protein
MASAIGEPEVMAEGNIGCDEDEASQAVVQLWLVGRCSCPFRNTCVSSV